MQFYKLVKLNWRGFLSGPKNIGQKGGSFVTEL